MRFQKYFKSVLLFFLPLLTILVLSSFNSAYAVEGVDHTINRILEVFQTHATAWEGTLQGYALKLFWLLAGIEFLWTAIKLVFRNADLGDFLAELTNRILYIGFFLTLLLNSSNWASAIVNSFRTAADTASGAGGGAAGVSPVEIIKRGLEIVSAIWNSVLNQDLMHSIPTALAGIVILVCFALMAANMIEALVESYIVISAGVLFMGFGGSSWTSEFAKKILIYAISVGAKLFVIQLIMGLGETLVQEWTNNFTPSNLEDVAVIVGSSLILALISKSIPAMVQGLLNGTSVGGGGISGSIGAAAATMMEAATMMATQGRSGQSQPNKDKDSGETPTATPRMIDPYLRANPDAKTGEVMGQQFDGERRGSPNQTQTPNTISPEKDD